MHTQQNKVVVITGAAVRVGRAIALELARAGMKLFCQYYNSEKAAFSLKKEIEQKGGTIHLFQGDLSQLTVIDHLCDEALRRYGHIDYLVNNAAIFYKTPFGTVTEAQWEELMSVNLKQTFFLSQKAGQIMLEQKSGKIVNIGDAGAGAVFPAYLPYSVSKAGVVALTKGLAKALAPYVQVNCINPGPVMMPPEMPQKEKEFAVEQTLLKREGNADDVAKTVRFLLEQSDYITGAVLPVDGGRSVR